MNIEHTALVRNLTDERRQLMERHERLTAEIIAKLYGTDQPARLEAMEDSAIEGLIESVRIVRRNRDRLRQLNASISELVRS